MPKRAPSSRPEYRLLITPHYNERRQLHTTLFLLETTRYFASFQYELSVDTRIDDGKISLKVLGLKAPQLSLPAAGHAQFTREFDNLRGFYRLTIDGLNGRTNTFEIRIGEKKVRLLRSPAEAFVDIVSDAKLWTAT